MRISKRRKLPPSQYLITGFLVIILLGSLFLSFPFAHRSGVHLTYMDALFTSVSAVCVTGLVTVDVAATFNLFGRAIIAILILLGGMGFAAVIMWIVLMLGWDVGISQRNILSEAYNLGTLRGTLVIVKTVVFASILFQIFGTILGYLVFRHTYTPLEALGHSLFHSISAFNNAGFDLMGDFKSMTDYRYSILLNILTIILIVSGGLGFFVLTDIYRKRWYFRKFAMHTKIVLMMTAILVVFGTLVILFVERVDILSALFLSVTARTAGFNTIDTGALSSSTLFFIMLLMFVGASPGSTGGGIKTTTAFAMWLSLLSLAFGKQPSAFCRRIPNESILKAFQVLMLALLSVVIGTWLISYIEHDSFGFVQVAFEAVSAYGTVGLSTGITTAISDPSKVVLMVLMFIGRLGPITIAASLKTKEERIRHIEERIFIG